MRNTNLVFKRDLGWEATENYIARSQIIKYGCHWDKVNFEAVLTDVSSRHTLFKYCPFHLYYYNTDVPTRQTVRKCTFFAKMGIVIKSSIKIHLGCSLQKQAKFPLQLIVFTTMISDIIVKNIILKICFFIYCIDNGESKGVDFGSTTKK